MKQRHWEEERQSATMFLAEKKKVTSANGPLARSGVATRLSAARRGRGASGW